MRPFRVLPLLFALGMVLGAGTTGRTAPAGTLKPKQSATQLMTGVTAVRKWGEFIYGVAPPGGASCEPFQTPPEDLGDGRQRWTLRDEFCVEITTTMHLNGDYISEVRYPDGSRETLNVVGSDFFFTNPDGFPLTIHFEHRLSDGDRVEYVGRIDAFDFDGTPFVLAEHYAGEIVLRGSRPVSFSLDRVNDFPAPPDVLHVEFPGGTELDLLIPFDLFLNAPDFSQAAVGEISVSGKSLAFQLVSDDPFGADPRWTRLIVGPESNPGRQELNGHFELGPDFSGRGQMFRGKKLDFAAQWSDTQTAQVILPNGQATSAGPAAGLLSFAFLRWSGLASAFGPSPGL